MTTAEIIEEARKGMKATASEKKGGGICAMRLEGETPFDVLNLSAEGTIESREQCDGYGLPLTIVFPDKYLPGNHAEGMRLAMAINGGTVPPADYREAYRQLAANVLLEVEPEFDFLVQPTKSPAKFIENLLAKLLRKASYEGWMQPPNLNEEKLKGALAAFAQVAKAEDVLAQADTTWLGTGEYGVLLTGDALYFASSLGSGSFPFASVENARANGAAVEVCLIDRPEATISLGDEGLAADVAKLLDQVVQYREHQQYQEAKAKRAAEQPPANAAPPAAPELGPQPDPKAAAPPPASSAPPDAPKIRFSCSACGRTIQTRAAMAGKPGKCPGCGAPVQVPALGASHAK
jgi:hypothetical protein